MQQGGIMTAESAVVDINHFKQLQIKVAKVLSAEKPEGADKLVLMKIDVGGEERQIVAGIGPWYSPDQMVGKTIVVVTNLKPATIRGHESRGMLLAALGGDKLALVTLDKDMPPGTPVS
jgi:methionyl-tRNA synthetase